MNAFSYAGKEFMIKKMIKISHFKDIIGYIINFLLEKGARADIFVLTMLGKTDIVKSMLKDYPALIYASGPHGFILLHHAQKGGKDAEVLFNHLQNLGLKETFKKLY